MRQLILLVRQLRHVASFKNATRALVVFLMLAGSWIATRTLDLPEGYDINDKILHLIVFFGFALLMDLATSRHPFWLWKGLPLLIYGLLIEIMQYFSPDRTCSLLDWAVDFSGILLYFIIKQALLRTTSIQSIDNS